MESDTDPRRSRFSGFYSPRTTPVPDNFFDDVLPDLSGAELKVLLYIFRRTFGWKKDRDNISLSQLVSGITKKDGTILDRGTGLSKSTVAVALTSLVKKGMVRKTIRRSDDRGHEPTTYEPVMTAAIPLVRKSDMGGGAVRESDKGLSEDRTHKKQLHKKTVVDGSPLKRLPDLDVDPDQQALLVTDILAQLGDDQSAAFYRLVARKVPESLVREHLAQIKSDGALDPRRLFTYRMQQWASQQLRPKSAT